MDALLAGKICFVFILLAQVGCREPATSNAFFVRVVHGAAVSEGGIPVVLPHTRLRVELASDGRHANEAGRLFVSRLGGPLDATPIYAAPRANGLEFVIDIGEVLGARAGPCMLHFATSTRHDALAAPTEATPGVAWARQPVRYALTPAGIRP